MMEFTYHADNEMSQKNLETGISVSGNHSWAGELPSFFIPAAKIAIGRVFSVFSRLVRRVTDRVHRLKHKNRGCEVRFVLPGSSICGRLVSRRLWETFFRIPESTEMMDQKKKQEQGPAAALPEFVLVFPGKHHHIWSAGTVEKSIRSPRRCFSEKRIDRKTRSIKAEPVPTSPGAGSLFAGAGNATGGQKNPLYNKRDMKQTNFKKKFKSALAKYKNGMYIIKSSVILDLSAKLKVDELIKNFKKVEKLTWQVKQSVIYYGVVNSPRFSKLANERWLIKNFEKSSKHDLTNERSCDILNNR